MGPVAVGARLNAHRLEGVSDVGGRRGHHQRGTANFAHLCADVGGQDALDDDALLLVLKLQRPRQVVHEDLRGGVHRQQRHRVRGRVGGEVDDDPSTAAFHLRQDDLNHSHHREEVAVDNGIEQRLRLGNLGEVLRVDVGDAHIVHQNVDVLQVAQLVGDAIVDVVAGEVDGDGANGLALSELRLDLLLGLLQLVRVATDQTEAVAHAGELFGVGEADAVGGPGDDCPGGWRGRPLDAVPERRAEEARPDAFGDLPHDPQDDQQKGERTEEFVERRRGHVEVLGRGDRCLAD